MTPLQAILRPSRRATTALSAIAAGVVVAGCGGAPATSNGGPKVPAALIAVASTTPPSLTIKPGWGAAGVRLDTPITVSTDHGVIDKVDVHSDADTTPVPGALSTNGATWIATEGLDPGSHYVVSARAHDAGGSSTAVGSFTTMSTPNRLTTTVSPDDGSTVGVGMPIVLRFDSPVDSGSQANIVNHIHVETSTPVVGAWHWFGSQEVHWRPKDYWPPGTKVVVDARLRGIDAGGGVWGLGDWSSTFTIGARHVSIIDAAAHQMQVFDGDKLIHTYPVSTGKLASPTISGTLFVWYKLQKVRMKSTSIGIPVNAPGGYDEDVFWDTAISTDGFFIHAAPWSVWAQGSVNVSHGCVNLSTSRAIEFYGFSQVGDVVVVKNTSRTADGSDGEADWQIPFDKYANSGGSATPAPAPGSGGGGI